MLKARFKKLILKNVEFCRFMVETVNVSRDRFQRLSKIFKLKRER